MSTDTMSNRSVLRSDRRTVTQLLAAAEKDTDAVSVFMAGCTVADTEAAARAGAFLLLLLLSFSLCEKKTLKNSSPSFFEQSATTTKTHSYL